MTNLSPRLYDQHYITGLSCRQELTPILPVRFSLTQQAIEKTKQGIVPELPSSIQNPNYQLRRLRQGYLYLYAELGMANNSTDGNEEKEGNWLVFEYYVSNEDANGSLLQDVSSSTNPFEYSQSPKYGLPYHFRKYQWQDGTPTGKWIADKKSFPYAFVHKQVTRIHYAYSERRWAAPLFKLIETSDIARNTLMQCVSLAEEQTAFSFPFSQLAEKVADFDITKQTQDQSDSLIRRTALGYNANHTINFANKEEEARAKVIAVFDHIGNLADVSCFHELLWTNMIRERRKYLYATSTAKAVMLLKPYFKTSWFKTLPYDEKNEKLLQQYAKDDFLDEQFQPIQQAIEHIATVHRKMAEQVGAGSIISQLHCLTQYASQYSDTNDNGGLNELNMQTAFTLSAAMQGLGISQQGMKTQAEMLAITAPYGDYISKLLAIAQLVQATHIKATTTKGLKRLELELLYESIMSAQFYRWTNKQLAANSLSKTQYLSAFGLKQLTIKMNGNNNIYSVHLEKQVKGLLQERVQLHTSPLFVQAINDKETIHLHQEVSMKLLIPEGQTDIEHYQQKLIMSHKIGIFLASLALLDTYQSLAKAPNAPLWDSTMQSTAALTQLLATFFYDKNGIKQTGIENVIKGLKNNLLSPFFGENNLIVQKFTRIAEGTAKFNKAFTALGHFANFMGIVVAVGEVVKGWNKNDRAARTSGILLSTSQTSLFFAGMGWVGRAATPLFAVGWILFAASLVFYYFADNEAEQWVREGFWGNSYKYWDKIRDFQTQIQEAEAIIYSNSKTYNYYQKEINDFYNLIWQLSIQNDIQGDNKLRIYCPAFNRIDSAEKLIVEWQQLSIWGQNGERGEQYTDLGSGKIKKTRLLTNCIELDFSETRPINTKINADFANIGRTQLANFGVLTLKYPKLGSSTEFFTKIQYFSEKEI